MTIAKLFSLSVLLLLLNSCSVEPQPIQYGSDACEFCRMTIADPRFASEIVTKKGKAFKFDSIECMIRYMNKNHAEINESSLVLVSNYIRQADFIHAENAFFAISEKIKSPMGEGLAAFASKDDLQQINQQDGNSLSWNELKERIK